MGYLNQAASRQLKEHLEKIECGVVREISNKAEWLSHNDAASLRWALSLARISKVMLEPNKPEADINLGQSQDRYRAELFALMSFAQNAQGKFNHEKIQSNLRNIEELAKNTEVISYLCFPEYFPKPL